MGSIAEKGKCITRMEIDMKDNSSTERETDRVHFTRRLTAKILMMRDIKS